MLRRSLPLLLFAYLGLLIILSQLDAVTDWGLLRQRLLTESTPLVGLLSTVLIALWALACSAGLRRIWQSREHRWLLRQPVSAMEFGTAWMIVATPALPPVLGWIWLTTPGSAGGATHGLAVLALSAGLMVVLALRQWLLGLAALALIFLADQAGLPGSLALLAALPWLLGGLGQRARTTLSSRQARFGFRLTPRGPISAAMLRDLLLAVRARALVGTVAMTVLSAAFLWALVNNGGLTGDSALLAATVLLAISVWPAYEGLERVQLRLSPAQRFPRHWPLSDLQRQAAVLGTALCLTIPGLLLLLMVSAGALGVTGSLHLLAATVCLACCIGLFLLLRELWYPNSSAVGVFLLTLITTTIVIALNPWSALAATLLFLGAGRVTMKQVTYG
ncbi:MAG: hypothetical protein QNJ40_18090 [Xanthomonadales bacterium]|nr:hypothetical protein [Xanthomonadales bacterium]